MPSMSAGAAELHASVIAVDNASTDGTRALLHEGRTRVISNDPVRRANRPRYRARQRGLRAPFDGTARARHIGNHSGFQRFTNKERVTRVARAELAFLNAHYCRPRAWRFGSWARSRTADALSP